MGREQKLILRFIKLDHWRAVRHWIFIGADSTGEQNNTHSSVLALSLRDVFAADGG
jgi:hypothetical protein